MGALIDLTGRRFGRLTVLGRAGSYTWDMRKTQPTWRCLCDCGRIVTVSGNNLKSGNSRSCGCSRKGAKHV